MAFLALRGVSRTFGQTRAVADVSLDIERGACVALLGPSGCGKSTTLNMIAGFLAPDAGDITIDGRSMLGVPPGQRNTGMVFQSYALFPHLDVHHNIAFGLRMRRRSRAEIRDRVHWALDLIRLDGFERRRVGELSGGQQQRVALARALVIEPAVLLLDEPLSNLDAKLRQIMRIELREIQQRIGITTIIVTHDQEEALAMADLIAVMHDGRLRQVGSPADLYERPADMFVADFVGQANVLDAVVEARGPDGVTVRTRSGVPICCGREVEHIPAGGEVAVVIRPERIRLRTGPPKAANTFEGTLKSVNYLGATALCRLELDPETTIAAVIDSREIARQSLHDGARVVMECDVADALLMTRRPGSSA